MSDTCWRDAIEWLDPILFKFVLPIIVFKIFIKSIYALRNIGEIVKLKTCPRKKDKGYPLIFFQNLA